MMFRRAKQGPSMFDPRTFQMKPLQMKRLLDERIVGNDPAKSAVATATTTHYNSLRYRIQERGAVTIDKLNTLLIGPTGVGKTYNLEVAAEILGVPFVRIDATNLTAAGYVGGDLRSIAQKLIKKAGGNIGLAQMGMVFIDEFDKVMSDTPYMATNIRTVDVQEEMLTMLEGEEISLLPDHAESSLMAAQQMAPMPPMESPVFNTRNVLFFFGGAFEGMRGTAGQKRIGLKEMYEPIPEGIDVTNLHEYGMLAQLAGRIPLRVNMAPLTADQLYEIAKLETNKAVQGRVNAFASHGIRCEFKDEALRLIADRAAERTTGARALTEIVHEVTGGYLENLPNTRNRTFTVNARVVRNPEAELKKRLERFPVDEASLAYEAKPDAPESEQGADKISIGIGSKVIGGPGGGVQFEELDVTGKSRAELRKQLMQRLQDQLGGDVEAVLDAMGVPDDGSAIEPLTPEALQPPAGEAQAPQPVPEKPDYLASQSLYERAVNASDIPDSYRAEALKVGWKSKQTIEALEQRVDDAVKNLSEAQREFNRGSDVTIYLHKDVKDSMIKRIIESGKDPGFLFNDRIGRFVKEHVVGKTSRTRVTVRSEHYIDGDKLAEYADN